MEGYCLVFTSMEVLFECRLMLLRMHNIKLLPDVVNS